MAVPSRRPEKKSSRDKWPANELDCGEVASAHCDGMIPTSLIIVADRGSLKAYRVNETPTRGPSLKLVQAFDVTDAHGKLIDKVTDLAGRYAASDGAGMHQESIAETKLETETERRINKQLADQITKIVKSNGLEGWAFAAPAACHNAIIELIPPEVRKRIAEAMKSELVQMEPAK